jgi:hypothetical protein
MPKPKLSVYDEPMPLSGDPLPLEGDDLLTQEQLAHHRIEQEFVVVRAAANKDSKEWRLAFNNMAANVRQLMTAGLKEGKRNAKAIEELRAEIKALKQRKGK